MQYAMSHFTSNKDPPLDLDEGEKTGILFDQLSKRKKYVT